MAKWAARPQLLFSDTVPVCHVDPSAATVIADVIASSARDPNNITAEEILTDGCGLMCMCPTCDGVSLNFGRH
jgi:hypothetical protein